MVFLRSQLNNQSDLRSLHSTWFKHQHPSAQHLASLYMFYPRNRQFLLGLVTCFFFFFLSFFLSFHIFSLVLGQKLMKNSQISGPPLSALHPPLGYADTNSSHFFNLEIPLCLLSSATLLHLLEFHLSTQGPKISLGQKVKESAGLPFFL